MSKPSTSAAPPVATPLPRVTIVTVVRNACDTIRDTIGSVLAQTFPDIQYIVVDGGSNDGTLDVIRSNEARIANWLSEPDRGIAEAFNKGLRLATGEYIMFLNADDWLADSGAIARLVAAARALDWPQVIYGDCDLYDRDSGCFRYRASIPYDRAALLRGTALPHPGLLMHRDYFARYGEFDESFRIAMDFDMFLRGVPQVGAHHAPVLVTNVRTGGLSTRDRAFVLEEIIRALAKNKRFRFWFEPQMLRNRFALRYWLRRASEALGLYGLWLERKRRVPPAVDAEGKDYGTGRSA